MLKKIDIADLKVGMFVKELDCAWMDHPLVTGSFKVKNEKILRKVINAGIKHAYIDSSKGLDVDHAPTATEVEYSTQKELESVAEKHSSDDRNISATEENTKAISIFNEAATVIHGLMEDARLGKQVEVESINPVAEKIIDSVMRNQYAFSGISRIKAKNEYTFMHCVSVAGLLVTFSKELGIKKKIIHEIAIGGLVHDVGKVKIPNSILDKPGKLTEGEFDVVKTHVTHGRDILKNNMGISQNALDVVLLHHERIDGTGYPFGVSGDDISMVGKMSSIVDVYDALTSLRVYKEPWQPTFALKKMLEWSPNHFSRKLVEKFIACLGIYPVGTLVQLESGRVAIVLDQAENMLRPRLRIIYNAKKNCYVKVEDIDLKKELSDKVLFSIAPKQFGIDVSAFL